MKTLLLLWLEKKVVLHIISLKSYCIVVWYFNGVNIINRTLHESLEMQNFTDCFFLFQNVRVG